MNASHDGGNLNTNPAPTIQSISAVTLAVKDMAKAFCFYQTLGFESLYGGEEASFSSFAVGTGYLNLFAQPVGAEQSFWGRVIFYVSDVDEFYQHVLAHDFRPEAPPRNAEWNERYFHMVDPDGHALSFARPLDK